MSVMTEADIRCGAYSAHFFVATCVERISRTTLGPIRLAVQTLLISAGCGWGAFITALGGSLAVSDQNPLPVSAERATEPKGKNLPTVGALLSQTPGDDFC